MLHGELLSFVNETGDKKRIFQRDNASITVQPSLRKSGFKISQ